MSEEKKIEGIRNYDTDDYDQAIEVVESETKVDLQNAKPKDLLVYFAERFKLVHGYEYKISWVKEVAVLKAYILRYGQDSGPMIELLFDKYDGIVNDQVMTVTAFSRGAKWIQDKLYIELKQEKSKKEAPKAEGLYNSSDFLAGFRVDRAIQGPES